MAVDPGGTDLRNDGAERVEPRLDDLQAGGRQPESTAPPEASARAEPSAPQRNSPSAVSEYPEIFIGLVGPIGTDHDEIVRILTETLRDVNYNALCIRFSKLLHDYPKYRHLADLVKEDERYKAHMEAGTEVRNLFGQGSALAQLAVSKIWREREELHAKDGSAGADGLSNIPRSRQAYILNSLKHPDEAIYLRRVYGSNFYLIAVHTPREHRIHTTAMRLAKSHFQSDPQIWRSKAEDLLTTDEKEDGETLGQNVRGTYPEADYFIVARTNKSIRESIERFVRLAFGNPFESPTIDELSMMHAKSSAMRSADLSRQVGAAIVGHDGRIVATGCNEVPKFGGGQYWGYDSNDCRDFQLRQDPNAMLKDETLVEVLGRLMESKSIDPKSKDLIKEMIDGVIKEGSAGIFEGSRVTNVIEFGRIIHAEMAAVTQAARFGLAVQDTTLYCTTFPCHMCARHLIAAGIAKAVYIEPYPKSLVRELYPDSIVVDPEADRPGFLAFVPFAGVAPRRFAEFFEKFKRKNGSGQAFTWDKSKAAPLGSRLVSIYTTQENYAMKDFKKKINDCKLDKTPVEPNQDQKNARRTRMAGEASPFGATGDRAAPGNAAPDL